MELLIGTTVYNYFLYGVSINVLAFFITMIVSLIKTTTYTRDEVIEILSYIQNKEKTSTLASLGNLFSIFIPFYHLYLFLIYLFYTITTKGVQGYILTSENLDKHRLF